MFSFSLYTGCMPEQEEVADSMDEENQQNENKNPGFESLDILISRWKDGTFGEIIDDWKWIFSYSARYKGAIAFYLILGIFSTSMGLVSSVASKYIIDIITGHDSSKLWVMISIMLGSTVFSLVLSSAGSRRSSASISIMISRRTFSTRSWMRTGCRSTSIPTAIS